MKSIGHIPEADEERFYELLDKFSKTKTALQLGVSFLQADHNARRQFLLHEFNSLIKEMGSTNGFDEAYHSIYKDRPSWDANFQGFRRQWIHDSSDFPGIAFSLEFDKTSKLIVSKDYEKEFLKARPDIKQDEYIAIDNIDFFELSIYNLLINNVRSYLQTPQKRKKKPTGFKDFFYDSDNWVTVKHVLENAGYINATGGWYHKYDNKSDLAILLYCLKDYGFINAPKITPAAILLYKEFGFEVGDGKYISSRQVRKRANKGNPDNKEFDLILRRLLRIT